MSAVNPFTLAVLSGKEKKLNAKELLTDVWNKTEEQAEAIIEEIKQEWVP